MRSHDSFHGCFSDSYLHARQQFIEQAQALKLELRSDIHPLVGKQGEELALDIAIAGPADCAKRLLITSGVHGVEGFAGSAIQLAAMRNKDLLARAASLGIGIIFAHSLNPYGFSYLRRVTHENVDLNRNFQDFSKPLPQNPAYAELHPLILPEQWPPTLRTRAKLIALIATRGMSAIQQAISQGQYSHPDGLFFGGTAPTWSHGAARRLMRSTCKGSEHLVWLDLHTGLGPRGIAERITDASNSTSFERAKAWFGEQGKVPLTDPLLGNSSSARLTGVIDVLADQECPGTQVTKLTLEYGTISLLKVLHALRGEQWAQRNPQAPQALREQLSQNLKAAFYIEAPDWQAAVVTEGLKVIDQALEGLGSLG